jgi:bifunctional DNA-binding transcriptional regulator/antitoxin component of YhaV-PrlF toxin-antitoxin module
MHSGIPVEVRRRYDGGWSQGFEIAERTAPGSYVLRRLSDGVVLPAEFSPEDVRQVDQ